MQDAAVLSLLLLCLVSLAFGSFIAALALRLPRGTGIGGRSRCPHCHAALGVRDLVPVVSWLMLRGRCRRCGAAIGLYYPAVELATLGLGLWAWSAATGWLVPASCGLAWTLLALALIDARDSVLPDVLTLPLAVAGLGAAWLWVPGSFIDDVAGAAAGYLAFTAIAWAYRRCRSRDGLGEGDAKLLGACGAWVGATGLPSLVLIAACLALAAVLGARIGGRGLGLQDRIPFGPALAAAAWLVWLYGPLALF
ncbi:MAG: prepilin peptidase [Stellaceae bacterium]